MGELPEEDGLKTYEVIISPMAIQAISSIGSKADRARIDNVLCILDTVPGIGRVYDPLHEAAKPDGTIMVAYAGHYGIYYEVSEERDAVFVYYLEDQRRDPMSRFSVTGLRLK